MMLADFHFVRPLWLLTLIPAVWMFIQLWRVRRQQGHWADVCDAKLLPFILQQRVSTKQRLFLWIAAVAVVLTIIAIAGPTWERLPLPVFRNDAALVIVLDLSYSMDAADVKPSRLERARFKIADILKQRKDGQTALVVFAEDAFTVTPLTTDTETIASQLNALTTGIMPGQGKRSVKGIELAIELMRQAGLQRGQILLMTDAVEEAQIDRIEDLLTDGYSLSVLGLGTAGGAPINASGGGFLKDAGGNILVPKLAADRLKKLAAAGNGQYTKVSSDDRDIDQLLAFFDRPNHQRGDRQDSPFNIDQWDEKGPWLLLAVIPLAALFFRKGLLVLVPLACLPYAPPAHAFEWKDLWLTPDQQAQQSFQQQQYAEAASRFDTDEWKAAAQYKAGLFEEAAQTLQTLDSADADYNRGNALARAGQLQQALEAYKQALLKAPDHADAAYNKELIEKMLKQQQDDTSSSADDSERQAPDADKQQQNESSAGDSSGQSAANDSSPSENSDALEQNAQTARSEESGEQSESAPKEQAQRELNEQADTEQPSKPADDAQTPMLETQSPNEVQQASEQWLKRIPDNPAGLLQRKFKYQYGQRRQP